MAGYQKATVVGNVGRVEGLRTTPNGKQVYNFSVGVSEGRDRDTTWFNVAAWGDAAQKLADNGIVGRAKQVLVEGPVRASAYIRRDDGTAQPKLELTVFSAAAVRVLVFKPQDEETPAEPEATVAELDDPDEVLPF